ncbi:hypothetical protein [Streptomyces sp. JJ36]|uniref:hypothetical protein n=1 Tax=Streptomyces sp. JJ36 TaxID=2736645 RepID=UPI001F1A18A2|nr:hypothetical protein [Streptomyces sp. JJ36]MCF6522102.1 hypothetical protein [Streptomyces sp. JJ36]
MSLPTRPRETGRAGERRPGDRRFSRRTLVQPRHGVSRFRPADDPYGRAPAGLPTGDGRPEHALVQARGDVLVHTASRGGRRPVLTSLLVALIASVAGLLTWQTGDQAPPAQRIPPYERVVDRRGFSLLVPEGAVRATDGTAVVFTTSGEGGVELRVLRAPDPEMTPHEAARALRDRVSDLPGYELLSQDPYAEHAGPARFGYRYRTETGSPRQAATVSFRDAAGTVRSLIAIGRPEDAPKIALALDRAYAGFCIPGADCPPGQPD